MTPSSDSCWWPGYSGADVRALCTEAAMGPIRSCADIRTMDANDVRPIKLEDFVAALRGVSLRNRA